MKKYIFLVALLAGFSFITRAQDDNPGDEFKKQEKIKSLYIAYITQHLDLNPEEAQKFWPVHTRFENDLKAVKPDLPELDKQQGILNIKKKYQENFNQILGPKRCERFFRMDGEFKRKLLERIRNRHQNKPIRPNIRMRPQ